MKKKMDQTPTKLWENPGPFGEIEITICKESLRTNAGSKW